MAIIRCPECKKIISDTSVRCPFCDFVLPQSVVLEQDAVKREEPIKKHAYKTKKATFFSFNWFCRFVFNTNQKLRNIPMFGNFLARLFNVLWRLVIGCIIFTAAFLSVIGWFYIHPFWCIEALLIGATFYAYFRFYKKNRYKYFFWCGLASTILTPFLCIYMLL